MSQIDLKHCTIKFLDGYVGPSGTLRANKPIPTGVLLVNLMAGYITGTTTMAVDGITGAVANGDKFTAAGDLTVYTITAHSEGSGNTNSITFTPGLVNPTTDDEVLTLLGYVAGTVTMAVDGVTGAVVTGDTFTAAGDPTVYSITSHTEGSGNTTSITFTPGLVNEVVDNEILTILPHFLAIRIGEGTLTFAEKRKMQYTLDRGLLATSAVREGDEEPLDVKFDFIWDHLKASSGDTAPTPEDVLKQRGLSSTWVSSGADKCEPYSIDVVLEFDPICSGEQREIITMPEFRYEELNHEAKQGIVSVTGKCKAKQADIVRVT